VEFRGFPEVHAALLKESRTRGHVQSCVQEIRGISLVFREMWDTARLSPKPDALTTVHNSSKWRSAFLKKADSYLPIGKDFLVFIVTFLGP
jgi:hypothetical protein